MKSQTAATESSGSPLAFIAWRSMRVIIVMLSIDWVGLVSGAEMIQNQLLRVDALRELPGLVCAEGVVRSEESRTLKRSKGCMY